MQETHLLHKMIPGELVNDVLQCRCVMRQRVVVIKSVHKDLCKTHIVVCKNTCFWGSKRGSFKEIFKMEFMQMDLLAIRKEFWRLNGPNSIERSNVEVIEQLKVRAST